MPPGEEEEHYFGLGDPRASAHMDEEGSSVPQDSPSEIQLTKQYGKGFSMLKKMGFKTGTGLGPTGEGITAPIEVSLRRKKEGLTEEELLEPPAALPTTQFDKIEKPTKTLTPIDIEKIELQREIEILTDKRRRIEYDVFSLSSTEASSIDDDLQIDELIRDLIGSQILSGKNMELGIFSKFVSILRDKYDCSSLWYELDIESVVTAAVANMVRSMTRNDFDSIDSILSVIRDIVIDDDDFVRILEFDIIEKFFRNQDGIITGMDDLRVLKSFTTSAHYESVFSRFTAMYLEELVKANIREAAGQLLLDWFPVIPEGLVRKHFLDSYVKPILVNSSHPNEVVEWRDYFSNFEWQNDIVVRITARILESLRRINPADNDAFDLVHVAVDWCVVVPPLLVGFLLVESGFLARWSEYWKKSPQLRNACKQWFPLLSKVCYRSPARGMIMECLRAVNGESRPSVPPTRRPGVPPRAMFRSTGVSAEGMSEAAIGKLTFGDVVRDECEAKNIPLVPKAGVREGGAQVYKLGDRTVYWKDDALFEKKGDWVEISLDSVLR